VPFEPQKLFDYPYLSWVSNRAYRATVQQSIQIAQQRHDIKQTNDTEHEQLALEAQYSNWVANEADLRE
jgi:hypothetical protein